MLKLEQSPHGRGSHLLTAIERDAEAQMWDRAPGPLPAESEVEEGGEDEKSVRQRAATARSGQLSWVQAWPGAGPGKVLILHVSLSFPQQGKQGLQGCPLRALHPNPHKPAKSSP